MSKRSEKSKVSAEIASTVADEMRNAIGVAAGPRTWDDSRESWIWRAAHKLGIEPRRAKAFWYREARRIEATEYLTIKQRLSALEQRQAEGRALHEETQRTIVAARRALAGGEVRQQRDAAPSDRVVAGEAGPANGGEG